MHTSEEALDRECGPPPYSSKCTNFAYRQQFKGSVVSLPPTVATYQDKDECNNFTNSMLRITDDLEHFTLHKARSEPAVAVNIIPPEEDSSPDTPQPSFDIKQPWFTGIFTCLRPVLSIIGKGGHEIRNNQDDWEIPFEDITDLHYLGCGGQGTVFSGMLNNEPVAVKRVSEKKDTDIRNLRKLNHPNIVKFKGVCTQPPCYTIIMEFCPYGPLSDLLKNQKNVMTTARVVSWAKQIASGMHYLHSHKIIHRDLKSPNVLIGENEVIKISDFGTSRTWSGVSEKMSFVGTVAWMPPEVIRELPSSEKVDIWSFGVVLWELLTCEKPYDGLEQSAIMYLVGCGRLRPPIPSTCPEGFKLIMNMCWKNNPRERPSFKLLSNHLEIASVEYLANIKDNQLMETQQTWKIEIQSEITQFKTFMQKHKIETQFEDEQLLKKREMELKHIRDIRELYERKLEKVNQMLLELSTVQQQVEQYRQGGRKREIQTKRKFMNAFMRKNERRKSSGASTTPTSPEKSQTTSPDTPEGSPLKAPVFVCLSGESNRVETMTQMCQTSVKPRRRHQRNGSGSPRYSGSSRSSTSRTSTCVNVETQTDNFDVSETDATPLSRTSSMGASSRQGRRVILEQFQEPDEPNANGRVQLHYMAQRIDPVVPVFTLVNSRCSSPVRLSLEDTENRNIEDVRYSSEDNLETIVRKVSALKNGNIFSDIKSSAENGNVTDDFCNEVLRKRNVLECTDMEDGAYDDSYTDEESEVYNQSLKRRSLNRRTIYPGRRSTRFKSSSSFQRHSFPSDEGNTSEYSVSPSSKSSTLESLPPNKRLSCSGTKMPNEEESDSSSESESEENMSIVTQVPIA